MLLYVLWTIFAVLLVWGYIAICRDRYASVWDSIILGIFMTIMYWAIGLVVAVPAGYGISYGLANMFHEEPEYVRTEENLVALQTRESTEGEFHGGIFASYGYVDGKRVLSYITQDDQGGIRTGYVDARNSVIYEGDEAPTLITYEWSKSSPWLYPAPIDLGNTYELHVPEESVVQGYEVAP